MALFAKILSLKLGLLPTPYLSLAFCFAFKSFTQQATVLEFAQEGNLHYIPTTQ